MSPTHIQDFEVRDATKTVSEQPNNTMVIITDLLVKINYAFTVSTQAANILTVSSSHIIVTSGASPD